MKLFYREYGTGSPMIILHGLLGSSDNWFTQARHFENSYHVYLLDQRNHGQSPHSEEMNYEALAGDLNEFIREHKLNQPVLIGHSMGGKTAMYYAMEYPTDIRALVVVDIAPRAYPVHHDTIVEAMKAVPLDQVKSRSDAERLIEPYLSDPAVRQFVLKNLTRTDEGTYRWRVNLDVIHMSLANVSAEVTGQPFNGPTLFINGSRSPYIKQEDWAQIEHLFPRVQKVTLNTGHWVQAEQPEAFTRAVQDFLATVP